MRDRECTFWPNIIIGTFWVQICIVEDSQIWLRPPISFGLEKIEIIVSEFGWIWLRRLVDPPIDIHYSIFLYLRTNIHEVIAILIF